MALQPFPLTHVLEARRAVPASDPFKAAIAEADLANAAVGDVPPEGRLFVVLEPSEIYAQGFDSVDGPGAGVFINRGPITGNSALRPEDPRPKFDPIAVGQAGAPPQIVYALPIPPEMVRYEPVPASVLTFTQDAAVVEDKGQRLVNVTVGGKVGLKYRLGTDRNGAPRFWDSPRLFYELREFIKFVLTNNATAGQPKYELIWRDFGQKMHQLVKLDPYRWEFDDRNKVTPSFEFRLQAYQEVKEEPASLLQGALGDAINGARDVADYIDTASLWLQIARANVADALNVTAAILEPIEALDRVLESVQDLTGEIANGRALVKQTIGSIFDLADNAIYTLERTLEDLGIQRGSAGWFEDTHAAIRNARDSVALAYVVSTLQESKRDGVHRIKRGDTLASIALLYYGFESEAPAIAAANNLVWPFISPVKIAGTLGPGDDIILPAASVPPAVVDVFPVVDHTVEERLFGVDVYRSEQTGEWEIDASGDDVRLVRGQPAAEQGLNARFATVRGANPVFPRVGLPRAVGEPNEAGTSAVLLAYLTEQAAADDRVEGVEDPSGVDGGTSVELAVRVKLRGNRATPAITLASTPNL